MRVHLPSKLLTACEDEASTHFPLESGGTFMGYVSGDCAYVEAMIPPGPKAYRGLQAFAPDQEWQLAEIAALYERSGRIVTYLGDWHSHPNAFSGDLSPRDRTVLRRIIRSPEARCPQPIMSILYGSPRHWKLSVWRGALLPRKLLGETLLVDELRTTR